MSVRTTLENNSVNVFDVNFSISYEPFKHSAAGGQCHCWVHMSMKFICTVCEARFITYFTDTLDICMKHL